MEKEDGMLKLRPKTPLYIALDGYDLSFTKFEVYDAKEMWRGGYSIREIARAIRGKGTDMAMCEIAVLVMDLAMKGEIEPRAGGVFGVDVA